MTSRYPSLLPLYHSVTFPFFSSPVLHHLASLNTSTPFPSHLPSCLSAFFSHLISLILSFRPGWGGSLFLICCVTLSPFLPSLCLSHHLQISAPSWGSLESRWSTKGRGQAKVLSMGRGSLSALCPWSPHQPQAVQDPCKQERDRLLSLSNWAGS